MRSLRLIGGLLWLCCLLSCPAVGQTISPERLLGRYQQFVWQDQHGLPQNGISAVVQTPDGYLWLATAEGVVRFDGVRFTAFDTGNTSEIKSNNIMSLLVDHSGALWIGTHGGGLSRYKDGRFNLYTTQDGLSDSHARSLFEDRAGNLWVGTDGGGLNLFRDGRFTVYTTANGLPDNRIWAMAEDSAGGLWVGTNNGLARFHEGRFTVYTTWDGLASNQIRALNWDRAGSLWVGMQGGLSRFQAGHFTSFGAPDGLKGNNIKSILQDQDNSLWFGTIGDGLYQFKDGRFAACRTKEGLVNDSIQAIYQDPDGDFWLGTNGGGLALLRAGRFSVYTAKDGLPNDMVSAIYEDAAGGIWVGTEEGLSRFKDGKFTIYQGKDGQPYRRVNVINQDREGSIWMSAGNQTTSGGAWQFREGHFNLSTLPPGMENNRISAILGDRAGNLWLGTIYDGLYRIRDGRGVIYHKQDGLADDYIDALFEDREGSLWIGTRGGLSRFKDERFTTWTTAEGFTGVHVLSFYEDKNGALWIGTHGEGLFRYKNGKFVSITSKNGLYDNLAFQILEDDSGNLWMSGNKGIYRASLQELNDFADGRRAEVSSFAYGTADGMLSRECNGANPAGVKTRDGKLWFPTIKGVVVIDPRKVNQKPPLVSLEQVLLGGEAQPTGQAIQIKPGQENLEIQYTALSWNRAPQIKFKYQMEGLDQEWVDSGTRRTAYYAYLPPGEYTFKVIADNGDGVWSTQGQSLRVIVLPPFYRTWWFSVLIALSVSGLILLIFKVRLDQEKQERTAQEAFSRKLLASQEQERQRIANELHDSLGQSLLIIKNRVMLAQSDIDEKEIVAEQLDELSHSTSSAIEECREIAYNLRPYQLNRFGLSKSLSGIFARINEVTSIKAVTDIDPIDDLLTDEAQINIYRIVQECVNNIIKHSRATSALLAIKRNDSEISLLIHDNGSGFMNGHNGTNGNKRGGFGLIGIAERVKILGGSYEIDSASGTNIRIRIGVSMKEKGSAGVKK